MLLCDAFVHFQEPRRTTSERGQEILVYPQVLELLTVNVGLREVVGGDSFAHYIEHGKNPRRLHKGSGSAHSPSIGVGTKRTRGSQVTRRTITDTRAGGSEEAGQLSLASRPAHQEDHSTKHGKRLRRLRRGLGSAQYPSIDNATRRTHDFQACLRNSLPQSGSRTVATTAFWEKRCQAECRTKCARSTLHGRTHRKLRRGLGSTPSCSIDSGTRRIYDCQVRPGNTTGKITGDNEGAC